MSRKSAQLDDRLHRYLLDHGPRPDELQRELIDETERLLPDRAQMQISPEQAAFLTLLTRIVGVRFAVEVGTFTGYSALSIARGLQPDGRLLCCDVDEDYTGVARRYWQRAGLADRIELRLGPALETLRALPTEATIDLAFIDADKSEYVAYWDEIVARTRPGGVITVDNVFAGGRVHEPGDDEVVEAIRRFNEHAMHDDRVELTMLPLSDGLTLARRR